MTISEDDKKITAVKLNTCNDGAVFYAEAEVLYVSVRQCKTRIRFTGRTFVDVDDGIEYPERHKFSFANRLPEH